MQFLCGFLLVCWIADSFDCNGASFQESKDKDDKKEKKSKEDNDDKKDKDTRACHITNLVGLQCAQPAILNQSRKRVENIMCFSSHVIRMSVCKAAPWTAKMLNSFFEEFCFCCDLAKPRLFCLVGYGQQADGVWRSIGSELKALALLRLSWIEGVALDTWPQRDAGVILGWTCFTGTPSFNLIIARAEHVDLSPSGPWAPDHFLYRIGELLF